MKKRILSLLLVAVMIASMIPTAIIPVFAEPSDDRVAKKVNTATLDGKNTNGEYDDANVVYLNAYGNDTDGDNMRVVYTDEAVYVLIEVYDDTLVRYATTTGNGTKAGSSGCDFVFLGFSLGTSFQGVKRVYRDTRGGGRDVFTAPDAYVNMSDGDSALETNYFGYTEDADGFTLEARFPVSEMSAEDKAAYATGTLELRFTAGTQDSTVNGDVFDIAYDGDVENRDWDGKATEDYFTSGSYKVKNPSNYTEYTFEEKTDYVTYVSNATLDGKNTSGEYDDALSIPLDKGTWVSPVAGDELRVIYSNDAIYALVEVTRDMSKRDSIHMYYQIGTSYVGHKGVTSNGSGGNLTGYKVINQGGTVDMTNGAGGYAAPAEYFAMNETTNGFSFEIKFPVSKMNETDKEAFKNGTLSVKIGASSSIGGIAAGASNTVDGLWRYMVYSESKTVADYDLTTLALGEKGNRIPFAETAPTLDGKNTDGEYSNAMQIPFTCLNPDGSGSWWYRDVNEDDQAYVVYTKEAIYVYTQANKGTTNETYDFATMSFKIGSSYVGTMTMQNTNNGAFGCTGGDVAVDTSYFVFSKGGADNLLCMEARFPVDKMTAADQQAYRDGTLEIKLGFYNQDNYKTVATFPFTSYGIFVKDTNAQRFESFETNILPYLTEYTLSGIVNYIPYYDYAAILDGKNSTGEYDDAYEIPLDKNYWWSGTTDAKLYAIYTEDAVMIYVERTGGNTLHMYFEIGTSFIGYKGVTKTGEYQTLSLGGTVNLGNAYALAPYFARSYDGTTFGLEAKFPVSEMNAADQEAFANGTLKIEVAASTTTDTNTGNVNETTSSPLWRNFVYNSSKPSSFDGYELETLALGTKVESDAEIIPHTNTAPYFDGVNTNGEYDKAFVLPLTNSGSGWWATRTPGADDVAYIMYTNNAIYVFIEKNVGTDNGAHDEVAIGYVIGSTYGGTMAVSSTTNSNYGAIGHFTNFADAAVQIGGASQGNSIVEDYFSYNYDAATGNLSLEARFPVANMTEADKAAFASGTLKISLGFMNLIDVYHPMASFPIKNYDAFDWSASRSTSEVLPNLSLFKLGQKEVEGQVNYIPHVSGIKMDGKITGDEYEGAFVLPLSYTGLGWWGRTPTDKDVAYIVYADDGIHVFVNGNKGTTNEAYDMTGVAFRIGESFVGTKIVQNNYFSSTLITLGKVAVTNDNNFFRYHYNQAEGILNLEVIFPVDKMTEEDQAAFKAGTLKIELGALNMDDCKTVASFPVDQHNRGYDNLRYQSHVEAYVLPNLTSFALKPYVFNSTEDPEAVEIKGKIDLKHNVLCFVPSYDGVMMKYTIGDRAPVYVEGVLVDEFAKEYSFTYTVSYLDMNETVVVELVDREFAVLEVVDTYKIVDYCQELLEKTAEELGISANEYEFMKMMVEATLALGNATENANGEAPTFGAVSKPVIDSADETFDVEILESGVYFDGEQINKMYVKFKAADVDKLTVGFATSALRYIATLEILPVDGEQDTYVVITPVIDATNFDDDYIISFSYAEDAYTRTTAHKITCNVNAGLAALAASENAAIADLAVATYNYGVAVRFYKAS